MIVKENEERVSEKLRNLLILIIYVLFFKNFSANHQPYLKAEGDKSDRLP